MGKEIRKTTKSEEDVVRVLLQKSQEKDTDAEPYILNEDQAKVEEITKLLKKEYAEKRKK